MTIDLHDILSFDTHSIQQFITQKIGQKREITLFDGLEQELYAEEISRLRGCTSPTTRAVFFVSTVLGFSLQDTAELFCFSSSGRVANQNRWAYRYVYPQETLLQFQVSIFDNLELEREQYPEHFSTMEHLPTHLARVYYLRNVRNLSVNEIADLLNYSTLGIQNNLRQTRAILEGREPTKVAKMVLAKVYPAFSGNIQDNVLILGGLFRALEGHVVEKQDTAYLVEMKFRTCTIQSWIPATHLVKSEDLRIMSRSQQVIPLDPYEIESRFSLSDATDSYLNESSSDCDIGLDSIEGMLDKLPELEADFVFLYYKAHKKQSDIAKIFGCTQAAVSYRLKKAVKRMKFLLSIPSVTEEEMRRDLGKFLTAVDVEILVGMYTTTCQSWVAEKLGLSQGLVRHRFFKNLNSLKKKNHNPYYSIFNSISENFNILKEVSLPQWKHNKGCVLMASEIQAQ